MSSFIADAVLAAPWLAVALPVIAGVVAIALLARARSRAGIHTTAPFVAAAAIAVVVGIAAAFVYLLGHMFAPSPDGAEVLAVAAAAGCTVALSGLAGYAVIRLRGHSGAGVGFLLGPVLLIAVPLGLATGMRELAQGAINDAYREEIRQRGESVAVVAEDIQATVVDGAVEAVRMRITITSPRTLDLVPSDSEIDFPLMMFRLEPPGAAPDATMYGSSPIGRPRVLNANQPVSYVVTFETLTDVDRTPGDWELVVTFTGDREAYERAIKVAIVATP